MLSFFKGNQNNSKHQEYLYKNEDSYRNTPQTHRSPMSPELPHRGHLTVAPVRGSSHPASIFNLPPKKVVRANANYTARFAGELSFAKGDFFYVINERPDGLNYEVINPIQRIRGIVPTSHFASLDKVQQEANARNPDYNGDDQNNYGYTDDGYDDSYNNHHTSDPYGQPPNNNYMGVNHGRSPLSPASPGSNQAHGISASGSGRGDKQLWSVLVQRSEQRDDGLWWFTVELKMTDNSSNILFRTYDDFWILQVSLLNHFPSESGRLDQPRTIPFLPTPTRTLTPEQAQQRRHQLDSYMQELIKLPSHIMNAPSVKRFLMVRSGDLDTPMNIRFDVSETLLDLLTEYQEEADLRIKLVLGEEIICWKEPDYISFEELMYHAEERLEFRFQALMYKDECEQLIPLRSNTDLRLLVTTLSKKLTFYVS